MLGPGLGTGLGEWCKVVPQLRCRTINDNGVVRCVTCIREHVDVFQVEVVVDLCDFYSVLSGGLISGGKVFLGLPLVCIGWVVVVMEDVLIHEGVIVDVIATTLYKFCLGLEHGQSGSK